MPSPLVELSRDECLELLTGAVIGRVVVPIGASRRPVIRPVNFAFDPASQSVVFRSVPGGKLHALLHAAEASFEVDAFDPEHRTGWSVIIQGVTEPVTAPTEVRRLERLTLHSWLTGTNGQLIRIRARTVSGRRIQAGRPH
jgi:nitroimidazol reductase NimA-like FMN-containing flavoprotein (pyridoxamine 5'-phosphate oxidase superfamily)